MKTIPKKGHDAQDILHTMRTLRKGDANWEDGKVWCLVYNAGEQVSNFLKEAHSVFFSENALNPSAFPSLKQMEMECVAMTADLLNGDDDVTGNMTSGGTESILMAIKAAREWGRERGIKRPNVVLPTSAHPAFPKAGHYFDVEMNFVPVGKDFRANVKAMKRAINRNTVMLVGSAPSYPQGVVDPIAELAVIAKKKKILLHVDACVGGFMLPFVRATGRVVPPFDFSIDGVTSLSVDLHKYGYAAKGASVVLFRNEELRKHMYYAFTEWTGGIYAATVMGGTRSGGVIGAAWAIINHLGFEGYTSIADEVMNTTDKLHAGIEAIDGVEVLGDPVMSILAIGSTSRDVYHIADEMSTRGWHIDRQQNPPSLHLTINHAHIQSADVFLKDLEEAVHMTPRQTPEQVRIEKIKKVALKAAVTVLPERAVSKATSVISDAMGLAGGDGSLPTRTAPMYGLIATLPNRGDLKTFVIDTLSKMMTFDASKEIQVDKAPKPVVPVKKEAPKTASEPATSTQKTAQAKPKATPIKKAPSKKAPVKKAPIKKAPAKTATTKASAARTSTPRKRAASKTTTAKATTTKPAAKTAAKTAAKPAAKTAAKPTTKSTTARKTAAKTTAAKTTTAPKKPATKKATPRKAAAKKTTTTAKKASTTTKKPTTRKKAAPKAAPKPAELKSDDV